MAAKRARAEGPVRAIRSPEATVACRKAWTRTDQGPAAAPRFPSLVMGRPQRVGPPEVPSRWPMPQLRAAPYLEPTEVRELTGATSINAGGNHTCAVLKDGTAKCWGLNLSGQVGNNETNTDASPFRLVF